MRVFCRELFLTMEFFFLLFSKTNDQRTAAKAAEEEEQEERALEHVVKKRVEHVLDMTKTTGMARNSLATGTGI